MTDSLTRMIRSVTGLKPKSGPELRAMAAALHHKPAHHDRVAVIWLSEVRNDARRQAIEAELEAQYGKRTARPP